MRQSWFSDRLRTLDIFRLRRNLSKISLKHHSYPIIRILRIHTKMYLCHSPSPNNFYNSWFILQNILIVPVRHFHYNETHPQCKR